MLGRWKTETQERSQRAAMDWRNRWTGDWWEEGDGRLALSRCMEETMNVDGKDREIDSLR